MRYFLSANFVYCKDYMINDGYLDDQWFSPTKESAFVPIVRRRINVCVTSYKYLQHIIG